MLAVSNTSPLLQLGVNWQAPPSQITVFRGANTFGSCSGTSCSSRSHRLCRTRLCVTPVDTHCAARRHAPLQNAFRTATARKRYRTLRTVRNSHSPIHKGYLAHLKSFITIWVIIGSVPAVFFRWRVPRRRNLAEPLENREEDEKHRSCLQEPNKLMKTKNVHRKIDRENTYKTPTKA
jgi:hypothetical protein